MPTYLLHPKYWGSWLAIGLLRLISLLPFKAKLAAGTFVGRLAYRFAKRRRHITQTNIRLCFPALSDAEQEQLVRQTLIDNAIGFFEIAWAWWANPKKLQGLFDIEGLEHLEKAQANGKGVLLVGAHFTHLDLCGLMLNAVADIDAIYRKNNNPVFEYIITKGRQRVFKNVLDRNNMKRILSKLREGRAIWYAPDQDYGRNSAVFAPFFGIQAATVVATSRLSKLGRATPLGLFHIRDPQTHRYTLFFVPIEQAFPTGDDTEDATIINKMIQTAILRQPSQYMWVHRRFKTRPEGEASFY